MARKKYNSLPIEERMRLEEEMEKYLIYDEMQDEEIGLRDDAPREVKDYYARVKWEAEETAKTGVIID